MPEDTCFKECPHYRKRDCCPNHVITTWQNDSGKIATVHDCAPRRALEMQTRIDANMVAIRGELNQLQHSMAALAEAVVMLIKSQQQTESAKTPSQQLET